MCLSGASLIEAYLLLLGLGDDALQLVAAALVDVQHLYRHHIPGPQYILHPPDVLVGQGGDMNQAGNLGSQFDERPVIGGILDLPFDDVSDLHRPLVLL